MNVIYKLYLKNRYNFFVPQLKLIEKVRVGSKIVIKIRPTQDPISTAIRIKSFNDGPKRRA
jgi:hypothetical protein